MFPLKYNFPDFQDRQKSGGRFIEILVNLDVVLRFLTFPCLIFVLFCSVLRFWIPFSPLLRSPLNWMRNQSFLYDFKEASSYLFNYNRTLPEGKKKKKHHKDSLSCICISWHPSSKKQTWETYQMPMHAVWNQSFCCQSKKITGSKHSCEESKGTCSSSRLWGVREKIRGKVILALQLSPLGYAWRNKKTKERKRTNERIWSKHKTQYMYLLFGCSF